MGPHFFLPGFFFQDHSIITGLQGKVKLKTNILSHKPTSLQSLLFKITRRVLKVLKSSVSCIHGAQTKYCLLSKNYQFAHVTNEFLKETNIQYKYQSEFEGNHSTIICLSYLQDKILTRLANVVLTGMIFINLQKAVVSTNRYNFFGKSAASRPLTSCC